MPETLVVVSYFADRSPEPLSALLRSMEEHPPGSDFSLCVVVNRGKGPEAPLPAARRPFDVIVRPNAGMNIGAWDAGWRARPGFGSYVFLQDDCLVVRPGWVAAFRDACGAARAGLVGESLNEAWDRPWEELRRRQEAVRLPDHLLDGRPANRVDVYLDFLNRLRIDPGPTARHLRALAWSLPQPVLAAIDGFPVGASYGECIAAEIGVSRKVAERGFDVRQVHAEPFRYIRHAEWVQDPSGAVRKRRPA